MKEAILTLTTDYGTSDPLVGTMKGAILSVNPAARIVDITHAVEPYDVLDGALALAQAWSYFPQSAIHVVVVDPGVGTPRRPILVRSSGHWFIAPDNGVLSLAVGALNPLEAWHLLSELYFRHPVSKTFHGRDIFGPVAAALSLRGQPSDFGPRINSIERIEFPAPQVKENAIRGLVLRVDRFGNIMTSLTAENAPAVFSSRAFTLSISGVELSQVVQTFGEGPTGFPVALVGSSGFLEIAVNRGNAARLLGVNRGDPVLVTLD
jgi:S-adenosylmethionine hydrolase